MATRPTTPARARQRAAAAHHPAVRAAGRARGTRTTQESSRVPLPCDVRSGRERSGGRAFQIGYVRGVFLCRVEGWLSTLDRHPRGAGAEAMAVRSVLHEAGSGEVLATNVARLERRRESADVRSGAYLSQPLGARAAALFSAENHAPVKRLARRRRRRKKLRLRPHSTSAAFMERSLMNRRFGAGARRMPVRTAAGRSPQRHRSSLLRAGGMLGLKRRKRAAPSRLSCPR